MAVALTRRGVMGMGMAATGAAALAACGVGGGAGGTSAEVQPAKVTQATTLVYWTNLSGADGSTMKSLAEQYAKETPLVAIEQIQGVTPYFDKVLASVAGGTPPDVLGTRMPYVPFLAEQGVIGDLSQKEIQQLGLRPEDFEPNVWRSGEWKGKRYSVPMDLNGSMLFFNAAAVRDAGGDPNKPPVTWQDWQEAATRLTQNDIYGTTFDNQGEALVVAFMQHLHQQGQKLFAADGKKVAFNSPQGVAALSLLADLYQRAKHPIPYPPGQGAIDFFEQRKLATWLTGPFTLNRLAKPGSPAFQDVRVALAPQFDPKKPAWLMQGFQLTLPRQPKADEAKRTAAFSLVNYLFNKGYEWSLAGKLPVSKKVLGSEQFQKSTDPVIVHLRLWEKYLPNATLIESTPRWVDTMNALAAELVKGVRKDVAPQAAIQGGERAANAVLAQ